MLYGHMTPEGVTPETIETVFARARDAGVDILTFADLARGGSRRPGVVVTFDDEDIDAWFGLRDILARYGDINGDGQPDIVIPDRNQAQASVWLTHGRTFTVTNATLPLNAQVAALVDLDHDGVRELVGVSYAGDLAVMKFHGNGTFTTTMLVNVGTPYGIAYGDVNGDGNQDVVVSAGGGVVTTLLGNGNGGWLSTATSTGHVGSIALGDVDGDHVLDLITSSAVEHGNGDGTFVFPLTSQFFAGTSIRLRDINGDSHLDIISSSSNPSNLVDVSLNNGDGTFSYRAYAGGPGKTVAVGDFDKDGRPDFVSAGNGATHEVTVQFGRCIP